MSTGLEAVFIYERVTSQPCASTLPQRRKGAMRAQEQGSLGIAGKQYDDPIEYAAPSELSQTISASIFSTASSTKLSLKVK